MPLVYHHDFGKQHGIQTWLEALSINRTKLTSALQCLLPEHLDDLLDVSIALYTADRICKRSPGKRQDKEDILQGRILNLQIPVRHPGRWDGLKAKLTTVLEALTFDEWNLEFYRRPIRDKTAYQINAFNEPIFSPFVSLFSGGLDSLAGAVFQRAESPDSTGILVVAVTNSRLRKLQEQLVRDLNEVGLAKFLPAVLPHSLDPLTNKLFPERQQEKSQRTRGFLYPALGAVVSFLVGANELNVYENGVGAINLPYTHATVGADHTRSMHPTHLMLMSRFISELFEKPFLINNRSTWQTKGSMCAQLAHMGLGELAIKSVSCDGFPLRGKYAQCGKCTSCLLRRVSLFRGGLTELEQKREHYEYDVLKRPLVGNEHHLIPLRFMLAQVERLHVALDDHSFGALSRQFPELIETRVSLAAIENRPVAEIESDLIKLYRNYVNEWDWFSVQLPSELKAV